MCTQIDGKTLCKNNHSYLMIIPRTYIKICCKTILCIARENVQRPVLILSLLSVQRPLAAATRRRPLDGAVYSSLTTCARHPRHTGHTGHNWSNLATRNSEHRKPYFDCEKYIRYPDFLVCFLTNKIPPSWVIIPLPEFGELAPSLKGGTHRPPGGGIRLNTRQASAAF
jgi:hypothetical protein